jgi:hypothetical protein
MARLTAVSLTEQQVRDRTKTVTRRLGWRMLQPGDRLTLCRKVMGRKPGEPLDRITTVQVTAVWRERLDAITAAEVTAEGFPGMTPAEFTAFFCASHRGCRPDTVIIRYLQPQLTCLQRPRRVFSCALMAVRPWLSAALFRRCSRRRRCSCSR